MIVDIARVAESDDTAIVDEALSEMVPDGEEADVPEVGDEVERPATENKAKSKSKAETKAKAETKTKTVSKKPSAGKQGKKSSGKAGKSGK